MTDYHHRGREINRWPRPRTRSLCATCGGDVRDSRNRSPWRGAWSTSGRALSIERDGREGREGRRRHLSSGNNNGQRGSSSHCYIVPIANGTDSAPTSTTYREAFRSPSVPASPRYPKSTPSSPSTASPVWSPTSSSPYATPSSRQSFGDADTHKLLSRLPSRLRDRDVCSNRTNNTTYRDHYTWLS